MKVTYTAGPDDIQVWEFDPDDVWQAQAEMVEKRYGKVWDAFLVDVRQGSARARRVLLWHLQRQVHHTLRLEDVPDFKMGAVKVEHSVDELVRIRERVAKSSLSEEDKEGLLAAFDVEISDAMAEAEAGKAPATDASSISSE
jgi:hypothetical protein